MFQPARLTDLPNEIILTILESPIVPINTLYTLACVCRRLHFIVLPLYLIRKGMRPGARSAVLNMRDELLPDLLSGLQIALFPVDIDDITCIFPHPGCTSISPLLPHIERVTDFISYLRPGSLRSVTIEPDSKSSQCLLAGDDHALEAWVSHFQKLLNCVVRTQCCSLTVRHGRQFCRAFEPVPPRFNRLGRLSLAIPRLFGSRERVTAGFRRVPSQGRLHTEMILPSDDHGSARLSALHIQSAILLVPPGLRWTLTALSICPITSLSISFNLLKPTVWKSVAPRLASAAPPTLSTLALFDVPAEAGFIALILISKLHFLQDLSISSKDTEELYIGGPSVDVACLRRLRAPPNYIQSFFDNSRGLSSGNLELLCVIWPVEYVCFRPVSIHPRTLSGVLASLQRRHRIAAPNPNPNLKLRLHIVVDSNMSICSSFGRYFSADETALEAVEELEISVNPYVLEDLVEVTGWVALFPRVRHVQMAFSSVGTADATFSEDVDRLVDALKATNYLHDVEIDSKRYVLRKC